MIAPSRTSSPSDFTNAIVPLATGWPSKVTVPLTDDLSSPQPVSEAHAAMPISTAGRSSAAIFSMEGSKMSTDGCQHGITNQTGYGLRFLGDLQLGVTR